MDIDAYTAMRRPRWHRLAQLNRQPHPSGAEIDELMELYRLASSDLAAVTSNAADPDVVMELTRLVADSRRRIGSARSGARKSFVSFFTVSLPLAIYRIGWLFLATLAFSIVVAVFTGFWIVAHPEVMSSLGTDLELKTYAEDAFASYYSNYPAPDFAAQVWTNNARLAVLTIATFFTGFVPVYLLVSNFASVGVAGAIMYKYGSLSVFFGLITPHGILELSCLVLSTAAALRLLWSILVPGEVSRAVSFAKAGREFVPIAVGLVIFLGISGLEEAFLTPSQLLPGVKVAVAVIIYAALVAWVVGCGHRAKRLGLDADIADNQAGYVA